MAILDDEYNRELISNAHPADWLNPEPAPRYNLVVIGGGTAGLVSAAGTAMLGGKVALIEMNLMGGDCLNTGCVPSKAVIRSSRVYAEMRDAHRFGAEVTGGSPMGFRAVMERMRKVRARISRHDSVKRFQQLGVDVFLGDARFSGRDAVEVGGETLRFKKAVIATGARPTIPDVDGLAEAGFLTNETVFNLTDLPRRLLVVGGGPLGCELAQAFRRFGCQVIIVTRSPQFLPKEDRDAAEMLALAFSRDGIDIRLNATVSRVTRAADEKVAHVKADGIEKAIAVDEILVGVGRAPNVAGLNLEAAGVDYDEKEGVIVNDYLRTTNPHVYAAGDVCSAYKYTHTAEAAARIVVKNALFLGRQKFSSLIIPWCTYTDPEIAHVGMYEHEAKEKGIEVQTITVPLGDVDRAITDGEEDGFVRIHLKKGRDKILGATIVARHAGEMISEITLAMNRNIGLGRVANVIHPYPTQAEAIKRAADEYNRSRLTPVVKRLLSRWMSWRR